MAWVELSFEIGGKTPIASLVRKMMFLGWPPTAGNLAPGIKSRGYDTLVFWVMLVSL